MLQVSLILMYRTGDIRPRTSFGIEPLHRSSDNGHFETHVHDLLVPRDSLLGGHELHIPLFGVLAAFPLGLIYSDSPLDSIKLPTSSTSVPP